MLWTKQKFLYIKQYNFNSCFPYKFGKGEENVLYAWNSVISEKCQSTNYIKTHVENYLREMEFLKQMLWADSNQERLRR